MKKFGSVKKLLAKGESVVLLIVILLVNLGNYGLNLFLGRFLGPQLFAEISMLATGILVLSFVALGFQMTAAKYVAHWTAEMAVGKAKQVGKWLSQIAVRTGCALALLLGFAAPGIRDFLHFESANAMLILAPGIPIYLLMSVGRGIRQGRMQFQKLAWSYLAEMLARLGLTLPLVYVLSQSQGNGIVEAMAGGFVFSFFAALVFSRGSFAFRAISLSPRMARTMLSFLLMVATYEVSQILISYSDIILVKHFFPAQEAGLYAALSLVGKVVYFATWSLVTVLFPKVVQLEKQGLPHKHLFIKSLLAVLGLGLGISLACYGFGEKLVYLLFGEAFGSISHLLGYYALATTLFAGANVFVYYYLSLNHYLPVFSSITAGLLQVVLIWVFHQTLLQIILVQIVLMSSLFTLMVLFHSFKNHHHEKNKTLHRLAVSS
jgi:O-antigen/teichoic acid export membrane protein